MQQKAATLMQHDSLKALAVKVLERNRAARQGCNTASDEVLQGGATHDARMQHGLGTSAGPTDCGPECYSAVNPDTGKLEKIYRPWAGGCKARFQTPEPRQVERTCWHCSGASRCGCISCAERLPAGANGECMICHGTGRALVWVH